MGGGRYVLACPLAVLSSRAAEPRERQTAPHTFRALARTRVTRAIAAVRGAGPGCAIHHRQILLLWSTTLAHHSGCM
jgi:hypothetical protein